MVPRTEDRSPVCPYRLRPRQDLVRFILYRGMDVVGLADMTLGEHIERELMLLKMHLPEEPGEPFLEILSETGARTLDDRPDSYTLELTASGPQLDRFVTSLKGFGEVVTVVRSGVMAITRGPASLEHGDDIIVSTS